MLRISILLCLLFPQLGFAQSRVIENLEFSKPAGMALHLDLYLPTNVATPRPVVVFVHGGGWKNGSRKSARRTASWLTEHGFIVAGIDYRLTDVAGWPAQIDDCNAAVRWLRDNAKKYNIDPDRIGAWGTSAGAHLAVLMGTRPDSKTDSKSGGVIAVCDWFGPTDLLSMPPNNVGNGRTEQDVANSNGALLLRATVRDVPDLARDASGLHHVSSNDASFLIMHGSEDPGVPLNQSTRLHQSLIDAGVASQIEVINGAGHGGKLFQTEQAKLTVRKFFQQTLMSTWAQGTGPNANFTVQNANAPEAWSVVWNEGIAWQKTLPETGQSTVTVWDQHLFFTTMQEVNGDAELGKNIVAWCCDAESGKTIWTRTIEGDYPLRLSGCFSDSSAPPAVTDGERVCFFNASGKVACFDFAGDLRWSRDIMVVGRCQPFLVDNNIIFTRQKYMPGENGVFSHAHKDLPRQQWTQLEAVDIKTGQTQWTSNCGVNMGSVCLPHTLTSGKRVIVVGRGGGHSPPEHPEGVSMIDAHDGHTIWDLPLNGFMSTMTFNVVNDHVLVFHDDEHLWVNAVGGQIDRRVSILNEVPVCRHNEKEWVTVAENLPPAKKKRAIIQSSNVLVGKFHFFRSYTQPYLGRVNVESGDVEYLQLPVQLKRVAGDSKNHFLWNSTDVPDDVVRAFKSNRKKQPREIPIHQWCFAPNEMKNSRGFVVMGDARSRHTGWGHHASQVPAAIGNRLFVPVLNGTVYVLDAAAAHLDQNAIISINDFGEVGKSYNRAGLSFANGKLYAHTIGELICIDGK